MIHQHGSEKERQVKDGELERRHRCIGIRRFHQADPPKEEEKAEQQGAKKIEIPEHAYQKGNE